MEDKIIVEIEGVGNVVTSVDKTIYDLMKEQNLENEVIAVIIDNDITELSTKLKEDTKMKLIKIKDRMGAKIYRSGLKFLYITAVKELFGRNTNVELLHSLDKGIYTRINLELNNTMVDEIKAKMHELVKEDIRITRVVTSRKEAISYFNSVKEYEKSLTYKQMTGEMLTLYSMLDYYNYFYTKMPYSTKILTSFDLTLTTDKGVMLEYPSTFDMKIPEYTHMPQVLNVFDNYAVWAEKLGVKYVSEVNNVVINGKIKEFIELNEIKQNNDLLEIANKIQNNINDIKIVLIAGPSSSGKTTTCKKLALYLKSKGLNPFTLSTDDFFKDRKDTPKNEKGEYEYDIPEAIDIDLFNEKLDALLKGEETTLPTYNFLTGEKEYKHPPVSLKNRDLLIVEGIHTLNELLTSKIPRENKLKIYISPFTPLGLDRHNHVSTVDLRLIRRIVRDARTRGYNAVDTLKSWRNVRISEEKYIFPYQKEADIVLNTALIYELGILKTFAVPLLYNVNYKSEYYTEAKRIINFLKIFLNIPESALPETALLREFVGGGYFE
ncbi:MAG TPA: AAA family ATPase [Firmicutes bacterium]|nr:AAA family ATPase [Bacillota bacterium]